MVAVQGRPDNAVFVLGLHRGFYAEQGLDVDTTEIGSGAEMVPALATNQVQVGNGPLSAAFLNAMVRGASPRIVADWSHVGAPTDTGLSIVVRKDLYDAGAVRSMRDLAGRKYAVGTVPGTVTELLYERALARDGASGADVETLFMPNPDIISALANRRIDAGQLIEPLVNQAVQQGAAEVLYPAGQIIPGAYQSVLQYAPQFAADQPDVATRFMVGYLKSVRDYYAAFHLKQNREAAIDLLIQHLPVKDPKVWEAYPPRTMDLNGELNVDQLKTELSYYSQKAGIAAVPDITTVIDPRFAEGAVRQLGRQ